MDVAQAVVNAIAAPGASQPDEDSASASSQNGRALLNKKAQKKVHRPREEALFSVCALRWRERSQAFALTRSRKPRFLHLDHVASDEDLGDLGKNPCAMKDHGTCNVAGEHPSSAYYSEGGTGDEHLEDEKKICSRLLVCSLASSVTKRIS